MPRILTSIAAGILLSGSLALAQDTDKPQKTLTIGDKAPSIKDVSWIKGKPVDTFKEGQTYLVECWATWCGPCIRAFPHLSKLQKQYKGKLRILGVGVWERGDDPMPMVKEFVTKQGDKMDYTVGLEMNSSIAKNWMGPAGQNGIPCGYLVGKEGRIEWIGHPGTIDPVLESYFAGTWDREAFAVDFKKEQEEERVMRTLTPVLRQASQSGDYTKAFEAIDAAAAKHPDMTALMETKFQMMLMSDDHAKDAYSVGESVMMNNWDNAQMLNSVSWSVMTNPNIKHRDLNFAMKAAERANQLTDNKDASILDTLARAYFDKGMIDKAIATQERAIQHAPEGQKDELKETLEKYLEGQPKVG